MWVGIPSVFLRVSGCNLRCTWCDTPYASWTPEGDYFTVDEIVGQIREMEIVHVVLTGGEPMLFDPIETLASTLKDLGHTLTVETAGTIFRTLACDLMSISPKLAHSTPGIETGWHERHERTRLNLEALQRLIDTYPYQLKFVVNPEAGNDLDEIEDLISKLKGVLNERILLMPEGTDTETLLRRSRMLVPVVMERNWRLTQRLHIDLFGNIKGT